MSQNVLLPAAFAVTLITAPTLAWSTDRPELQGEQLFTYHGCVNCHGASGKDPSSKLVPKIGGLEADDILAKAQKILRGEGESEEAKLMHSAVAYSQSCDAPPTQPELQKIATWLALQK
ncbi:c-type cytochrome [Thiocapsa rosea]|uniref:Cytochrome c n=1 Tax=Thiocapsa rosea TaxID=69360 RepID=A0A495V609_9GAMM|nr:c-type cytochrome [Thiocapsa rosea]RKT44769.1 cytochrome c [Thiocapsa rosea]